MTKQQQPILADRHELYPNFEIAVYGSYIGNIKSVNDIQKHKVFSKLAMRCVISPQFYAPIKNKSLILRGFGIDNGAYSDHLHNTTFDEQRFLNLCKDLGPSADWIVIPDVVADKHTTIKQAHDWIKRIQAACPTAPLLFVWQDGMTKADLLPFVRDGIGIFIGGSTEPKLKALPMVGQLCKEYDVWSHCGRVNTNHRTELCIGAGIKSCDGSGYSRFTPTVQVLANMLLPKIDQLSLFAEPIDFSMLKTFEQRNQHFNFSIFEYDKMLEINTDYHGIRPNEDKNKYPVLRW